MEFDPILDQDAVVVLGSFPPPGEGLEQRERSKSDLGKWAKDNEARES